MPYVLSHPATGKVANLYSSDQTSAVPNGARVLLYSWQNNDDQKWEISAFGVNTLLRLKRDGTKVLNRHSINNNAHVWTFDGTPDSQQDSFIDTETTNGNVRIKLVGRTLYLTKNSADNYLSWQSKIESDRQYFKLQTVEDYTGGGGTATSVTLPSNRKYNWSQFDSTVKAITGNVGCSLTAVLDVANILGPLSFSAQNVYDKTKWNGGIVNWLLPANCVGSLDTSNYYSDYCNNLSSAYAMIKSAINNNKPVIIKTVKSSNLNDTHFVVAIKYTGSCTSANDIRVLDPATAQEVTLTQSFATNNKDRLYSFIIANR